MSLPAPSIEYARLSPMLIVFTAAIVGLLVETFLPRAARYAVQLVLSITSLGAAFVAVVVLREHRGTAVLGAVAVDGPALFLQGTILLIGIASVALIAERRLAAFTAGASTVPGSIAEERAETAGIVQTEVFPLTMLAIGGMVLFAAANDLLTMFVALEVFSLPLYVMCGLARRRRLLSQEAALKYFLLGAFSSAFFLYGVAMLYGYAGTVSLSGIGDAVAIAAGAPASLALLGVALLSAGFLFKVGAVPFHSWIPDVYQGAPTPITGFMAAATKIAAFGAAMRVFYVAMPGLGADWRPLLSAIAVLTIVVAAILTVAQTNIKRLLAYSSITNVGFILIGIIAAGHSGMSSTLFYLVAYGFSTLGAFAVAGLIRDADGEEDAELSHWAGLGRRYPLAGVVLSLFLLALAGIPLTSGFASKFAVFQAAMDSGHTNLVVVGAISSVIAAFAYTMAIVVMFFNRPGPQTPQVWAPGRLTTAAISAGMAVTVLLGLAPQPLLDLADQAGQFAH